MTTINHGLRPKIDPLASPCITQPELLLLSAVVIMDEMKLAEYHFPQSQSSSLQHIINQTYKTVTETSLNGDHAQL